jgi:hypothetical protein
MANELSISGNFRYSKNGITQTRAYSDSITVSGNGIAHNVQVIGTTAEVIAIGDVASAGYSFLMNIDATNFVEIGREDTGTFRAVVKLLPGEFAIFRAGATLYGKADTANCRVECFIFET